jgi:cytochrome oxidase Cu insertion factor (SCO1/SenC/PrrC family)
MSATTRWALVAAVPLVAVAALSLAFLLRSPSQTMTSTDAPVAESAAATWPAGRRRAPDFALQDEHGRAVSLAAFRGRAVLLTFLDPLCRDFCPIEAQHLSDVVRAAPADAKPVIVAVSVNPVGNTRATLTLDRRKWHTAPEWRWAIGSRPALRRVWHAYGIVVVAPTGRKGDVVHTEAAYLVDANGFERALFVWPYSAHAVRDALSAL